MKKTLTVRLPDSLVAQIDAEAERRDVSRSDIVRERLEVYSREPDRPASLDAIDDLIGSVDALPADLSANTKAYLKKTGYGGARRR
jgi:Arc/MetJ-type ribon-helix-helix transcriptional regulator